MGKGVTGDVLLKKIKKCYKPRPSRDLSMNIFLIMLLSVHLRLWSNIWSQKYLLFRYCPNGGFPFFAKLRIFLVSRYKCQQALVLTICQCPVNVYLNFILRINTFKGCNVHITICVVQWTLQIEQSKSVDRIEQRICSPNHHIVLLCFVFQLLNKSKSIYIP